MATFEVDLGSRRMRIGCPGRDACSAAWVACGIYWRRLRDAYHTLWSPRVASVMHGRSDGLA